MSDLFDLPFEDEPVAPVPATRDRPFTVSELTANIRELLETRFFAIWIEGELSNCRRWNTGHLYFTLKDTGAQLRAVMFRSAVRALRFAPEDGLRVVARGRLGVYEPKGEYQLVCEHLEPQGLGAQQLAVRQLKRRLQAEGLFDAARKRPLPLLPRKIGVVTSLDGAALRDIVRVLARRHPNAHLVIGAARVQGEDAAPQVARALRQLARVPGVDVIIVGRGGGSVEDLHAFNGESVARAIAACPVPVISAVGHEVDLTVADLVADVRASTPSAAAEIVVSRKDEFCASVDRFAERARLALRRRLQQRALRVHQLSGSRGLAGLPARLALRARDVAQLAHDMRGAGGAAVARHARATRALHLRLEARHPSRRLAAVRARLVASDARLATSAARLRHGADARLRTLAGRLEGLSPLAVLARGYAVCWSGDRSRIVRDATTVDSGDVVRVVLQRGELTCAVREVES